MGATAIEHSRRRAPVRMGPEGVTAAADVTIGADGVPRVAWTDGQTAFLTTCADLRCG